MNLTSHGRQQAELLGQRLASEGLDRVQTSPRERTRETADAIGRSAGVPVEIVDALDEIDFGAWAGRDFTELSDDPLWQEWNTRRDRARCPDGETMGEATARITSHLQELARTHPGKRIALVSHADMLRGLIASLLGLGLDKMLRFEIAPASISRVDWSDSGAVLQSLNDAGHLGRMEGT